jgi:N-acetyl-anhydromuramyl-L-alanine amidase AmpD
MYRSKAFLRDMLKFPLAHHQEAEVSNLEPGKCNNFNFRFRLDQDGKKVFYDSQDQETLIQPIYLLQHHTVADFEGTTKIFIEKGVSAHFVIAKDGVVEEFVDPKYRAYHAGVGSLKFGSKINPYFTQTNFMNSMSVGIENVNNGNEPYSLDQMKANISLCSEICDQYPTMEPKKMLGHSDWSPGRKIDPNPYFPWKDFAQASDGKAGNPFNELGLEKNFGVFQEDEVGVTPDLDALISWKDGSQNSSEDIESFQESLREYGYDIPDTELGILETKTLHSIFAFKLHFCGQEILTSPYQKGFWEMIHGGNEVDQSMKYLCEVTQNHLDIIGNILDQPF